MSAIDHQEAAVLKTILIVITIFMLLGISQIKEPTPSTPTTIVGDSSDGENEL